MAAALFKPCKAVQVPHSTVGLSRPALTLSRSKARAHAGRRLVIRQTATPTTNGETTADKGNGEEAEPLSDMERSSLDSFDFDSVLQKELLENGPRTTRRTRIICTIGLESSSEEMLDKLAQGGMNCARLNMTHGSHEWHRSIIERIRNLNKKRGYSVAIMLDTEGSEVHLSPCDPIDAEEGQEMTLTIRKMEQYPENTLGVSYEGFIDDVQVGNIISVDGGMVTMEVVAVEGPDVRCVVIDPGLILSRANLTFRDMSGALVRGKNANLPVITSKDWLDIDFAVSENVDFIAISFVKSGEVLANVKSYISSHTAKGCSPPEVVAKVESADSIYKIPEIVKEADVVMIARGDLGAQIPLQEVPAVQQEIVLTCRREGTPVIVASHLLSSMIQYPTPTRAEVADIGDCVRQKADALMLSGESAMGSYPEKCVDTLRNVCTSVEEWYRTEDGGNVATLPNISEKPAVRIQEEMCAAAASMADNLQCKAICVFTRTGKSAYLLSRCRPDCPIFAFTDDAAVRRKANLRWGVMPFRYDMDDDMEVNVQMAFTFLKYRGLVESGDTVVLVSDLHPSPGEEVRSVQVRTIK